MAGRRDGPTSDLFAVKVLWQCTACGFLALTQVGDQVAANGMRRSTCVACNLAGYREIGFLLPLVAERGTGPLADDSG